MQTEGEPGHDHRAPSRSFRLGSAARRHSHAIALAAVVLASLVFRVHVSRACSLWLDEGYTHVDVVRPWPAVLAGPEPWHPPLFFVLTKLALIPFGYSETALRAVSLGFGCVLIAGVYWLCLELGLAATRALAIAALLAITPFFMRHTIEARQYALYPALGTLATACCLRSLRQPKHLGYVVGFAISAGAMAATHYFGLAYAVALFGALCVGLLPRWKELELTPQRSVALALVVAALLVVLDRVLVRALALANFYARNKSGDGTLPWRDLFESFVEHFSFVGESAWVCWAELVLAAAGLVLVARGLRGIARVVPFSLAFGPCAASLLISSGHFVAARYLAPSWVLYHVGACVGLLALADGLRRLVARKAPRSGIALAGAIVLLPLALRLAEYPADYGAGEDDYRGFQRYFMEHFAGNTALVTFPGHTGERIIWEYPIGTPPIELEHFRKRPGVDRYLVAELHAPPPRAPELERLALRNFGLTRAEWRALPLVDLPETTYQPPVRARLVVLTGNKAPMPRTEPRRSPRRRVERGSDG